MRLIEWKYQDCRDGKNLGECCQECVAGGELLCCECREKKEVEE